ncbi:MAG TPA: UDP-N-acetylmuramate--L-alanine ligase [Trueperaceae bacterium]
MKPHLHFMGIGGVSMSGLARHYRVRGFRVSGCDSAESPVVQQLRKEGIEVALGHHPSHLEGVDLLVTTMAVPADSEESCAAPAAGVETIRRIELLRRLFADYQSIGVTGTHGKSTTTGMIAQLFIELRQDPSVQLGATLPMLGGNMRTGRGRHLIAEVDESDPGFARLSSEIAVLINLEDDHIAGEHDERRNYHASLEDLEAAARSFAVNARKVIACADWPSLREVVRDLPAVVTYGLSEGADYRVTELALTALGSSFTLRAPGGRSVKVTLTVPGVHNAQNAAAALATADVAGLPLDDAARALATFGGVGRRWQRWGDPEGALIIDDYAHHPTEVEATLKAARNTGRRVRAVLQPHRWVRTARHWPALADAAALADEVIVLDVYAAGETRIPGVSVEQIVERIAAKGRPAAYHDQQSAIDYLRGSLDPDDLVITLGAGDVWKVAESLSRLSAPVVAPEIREVLRSEATSADR